MAKRRIKSNIPCSFLENFFVNTTILIVLTALDCIAIFNFADTIYPGKPESLFSFAMSCIVLIDVGAIVLGHFLSKHFRRQTLLRMVITIILTSIAIGVGFLIALRVLGADLSFGVSTLVGSNPYLETNMSSTGEPQVSGALMKVLSVFMAIEILGTSAISFSLSALRAQYKRFKDIENLENMLIVAHAGRITRENVKNTMSSIDDELNQSHLQEYSRVYNENRSMKERLISEVILRGNMHIPRPEMLIATPAPHRAYAGEDMKSMFGDIPSPVHPQPFETTSATKRAKTLGEAPAIFPDMPTPSAHEIVENIAENGDDAVNFSASLLADDDDFEEDDI